MWEIWTRKIPHSDSGYRFSSDLKAAVIEGYRPNVPDDCPEAYAEIIKKCWAPEGKNRPSFSEVEASINVLLSSEYDVEENMKDPNEHK